MQGICLLGAGLVLQSRGKFQGNNSTGVTNHSFLRNQSSVNWKTNKTLLACFDRKATFKVSRRATCEEDEFLQNLKLIQNQKPTQLCDCGDNDTHLKGCCDASKLSTQQKLKECPPIPTAPKQTTDAASLTNPREIRN